MSLNPVERRVQDLGQRWLDFRDQPLAKVLVWKVPGGAVRLAQCFLAMQVQDVPYATGDSFVLFETPFENTLQYSRALKTSLVEFDAKVDAKVSPAAREPWGYDARSTLDHAAGFVEAAQHFAARHHQAIRHLGLTLAPKSATDARHLARWIAAFCRLPTMPAHVHLLVLDNGRLPGLLEALTELEIAGLVIEEPPLDAFAVAQESFAQEVTSSPAGVFRTLMTATMALVEKGSADAVIAKARDAMAFARRQGWPEQEVALNLMMGGALLKEKRHAEALAFHEQARTATDQLAQAGHPAGKKLMTQALFGEAGVHVASGAYGQAARLYETAAASAKRAKPVADAAPAMPEPEANILELEARRMAGWCHAKAGDRQLALQMGELALVVGARMKPVLRASTTLATAVVDMLREVDAKRVLALTRIKQQHVDTQQQMAADVEAQVPELLRRYAHSALEHLTQQQEAAALALEARTLEAMAGVVAAAAPEFVALAQRGDDLMGPGWLLKHELALPVVAAQPAD